MNSILKIFGGNYIKISLYSLLAAAVVSASVFIVKRFQNYEDLIVQNKSLMLQIEKHKDEETRLKFRLEAEKAETYRILTSLNELSSKRAESIKVIKNRYSIKEDDEYTFKDVFNIIKKGDVKWELL